MTGSEAPVSTVITGIGELVTNDPANGDGSALGIIADAAVVIDADRIEWVGPASSAPAADRRIDLDGRAATPGFVDSHSHLVFAGDRAAEFMARMTGTPYDGGGIAATVRATRAVSDLELTRLVAARIAEMRSQGTTTVEIKSGYGLTVEDERRSLSIAGRFSDECTFLGAHVVPPGVARDAYVDLVIGPMLDACAGLARWIDVFCEPASGHAFDADEAATILQAGVEAGLRPRVHGNQLALGPGAQLAVRFNAASVDHCTFLSDDDVDALSDSDTVATLLPGVEFATRSPYPSGRRLIDAGVTVAIASDCNPGTCYSSSMPLMIALAVRDMGMTPAEALWSATAGGAKALDRPDVGTIAPGKRADIAILDAPSYLHLSYRPGVPLSRTLEL
jgi:imidazolonepropionase